MYKLTTVFIFLFLSQTAWGQSTTDWTPGSGSVIGAGWNFSHIFAGNDGVIYAIDANGRLIWYRRSDPNSPQPGWAPGIESQIGSGWSFKNVFSGGNGVIYAIASDGRLLWYKRSDPTSNQESWAPGSGSVVGTGWHRFKFVAGAENGIIYAVEPDGRLLWYQRPNPDSNQENWAPGSGSVVGTGWHTMQHFLTSSNGLIYGVDPNNRLIWYQRPNPNSNQENWAPGSGNVMGTGWVFEHLFAGDHGRIYAVGADKNLVWYQYVYGLSGTGGWQRLTDVSQLQTGDQIAVKALYYDYGGTQEPINKFLSLHKFDTEGYDNVRATKDLMDNTTAFEVEIIPSGPTEDFTHAWRFNFDPNPNYIKVILKAPNGYYLSLLGGDNQSPITAASEKQSPQGWYPQVFFLTKSASPELFKFAYIDRSYEDHINFRLEGPNYSTNLLACGMRFGYSKTHNTKVVNFHKLGNGVGSPAPPHQTFEIYYKR